MSDVTTTSSPSTGFNPGSLFFPNDAAPKDSQSPEISGGASLTVTEDDGNAAPLDGIETTPGTESSADEWEFNGGKFTADQISEALKHQETFTRFNTSITPLVQNIKSFGDHAARFQAMAVTETDKQIQELRTALNSGQLNAADYQRAHQSLQMAETRKGMLEEAGKQVDAQRTEALNNARRHNASQTATNLVKQGWTVEQMNQAQSVVKGVMSMEAFADNVSPAFMEILRDAYELRSQKAAAAAKLQDKVRKVTKTPQQRQQAPAPAKGANMGSSDWMKKNIWGGN
ncbi:hypothetical protein [Buttiauxella sp.]|uniref:hypothetical protein n=1 Tax=Buttiauxella sp. TaxID=1972222 RepID=UPI003C7253DB